MSGKNNVNPGQYKVAGREKPGKTLGPEKQDKEAFARARSGTEARAQAKQGRRRK